MRPLAIVLLLIVGACGAEAPPTPPAATAGASVTLSGEAKVGITVTGE
jgi:hypothetical protein